jgi:hypothetical protein
LYLYWMCVDFFPCHYSLNSIAWQIPVVFEFNNSVL